MTSRIRKCFVFDLDKTLWKFIAEDNPNLTRNQVQNLVFPKTFSLLNCIKQKNHKLAIASRGINKGLSMKYLRWTNLYPYFDTIHIYPTNELYHAQDKTYHLKNISNELKCSVDNMIFFDDEEGVIEHVRNKPYCFHCPDGITDDIYDNVSLIIQDNV